VNNRIQTLLLLLFVISLLMAAHIPAGAEPYIAMRTGFKCGQCHVNLTGGGKRTDFGNIYSQTNLPMNIIQSAEGPRFLHGKVSEFLSMGADLRADNVSVFEHKNSNDVTTPASSQLRISEANLYIQADLIPGTFLLYADQTLSPSAANREFFGLLRNSGSTVYGKVGRMLLPYGLRLQDDDAFVRRRTGFTYNRHDLGAELGLEPGPISLVSNVTDSQLSVVGSTVFRRVRVGGSYARSTKDKDRHSAGAFGGVNFGRFTLLGEGDFITEDGIDRFAGLAEVDILIVQGFNFKTTYEFFDRNRDISNDRDGQERITIGVEPFIAQFLQLSLFYRINRFIPQATTENQDQLTLQFHAFF